jgi:outer membrane protein TolC
MMNQKNLQLASQEIDEALTTVENMEKRLNEKVLSSSDVKTQFVFLSKKVQELEHILKQEGILE